ncbi:chemotaxis protein histidine kinase [Thiohalobacter thiocyanaticus]|uniref:Chemotaxis protein histidine kinase n=1 Tax=Thiohalobacter thiocyanaticus TaxID=585455 RepID=A0A1Z4VQ95_9GAMM|nr:chemotaxis protein histidine kinase [Thiohalobacter thiocyanaticus]
MDLIERVRILALASQFAKAAIRIVAADIIFSGRHAVIHGKYFIILLTLPRNRIPGMRLQRSLRIGITHLLTNRLKLRFIRFFLDRQFTTETLIDIQRESGGDVTRDEPNSVAIAYAEKKPEADRLSDIVILLNRPSANGGVDVQFVFVMEHFSCLTFIELHLDAVLALPAEHILGIGRIRHSRYRWDCRRE